MGVHVKNPLVELSLPPGFRFYPTDEELLVQYLCKKIAGHHFSLQIIGEIDLYKFNPWVLPTMAMFGEKEWYFFSPRDRKYPNGSRPNRVAGSGYWKATGTDKVILTQGRRVGIKKALVFYIGKARKGTKTNWIMHEYRLTEPTRKNGSTKLDDWVLCRIYKKNSAKPEPGKPEPSMGGSSSSSSSHLDDVFESLPQPGNRSSGLDQVNSQKNASQQPIQEDTKFNFQQLGSGSFDWNMLAGLTHELGAPTELTQPQGQGNDFFLPSLPPLTQVDSPMEGKVGNSVGLDEEVQSGVTRGQRVGGCNSGWYNHNSDVFTQSYLNSGDPFAIRDQTTGFGFGFGP